MKKLLTLIVCVMAVGSVMAQAPDMFNYQAVARDGSGNILANESINVTFLIHSGTAGGAVVFEEDHTGISTNDFGLFNLQIGDGTNVSGSIDGINWGSDSYFLEIEVNGASAGTQQLVSVPYALEAGAPWERSGSSIIYEDGKVFIGRSSGLSSNEFFGIRTATGSGSYGGMYVETEAGDGRPFYGYGTNGGSSTWTYLEGATGNWKLYNSGTRMTVTQEGKYGLETASPAGDLHLIHDLATSSADNGLLGLKIENEGSSNNSWTMYVQNSIADLYLYYETTAVGRFDDASGAYSTLSDARFKEDVEQMPGVLSRVKELPVQSYKYKHQQSSSSERSIGFMAQDVMKQFPELVTSVEQDGGDGVHMVNYAGFGPIAIKAIQEQQQIIESMQEEIDALKKEIEDLK